MKCVLRALVSSLLMLWIGVSLSPASLRAQISSEAFDRHCYQPKINTPGVFDTIVGRRAGDALGAGLTGIGPVPNGTTGYNRFLTRGLPPAGKQLSVAEINPEIDLHSIQGTPVPGLTALRMFPGHFRSPRHTDLLLMDSAADDIFPKIYWSDDNGNFDTSRYTSLFPSFRTRDQMGLMTNPYMAHLTSDSVDDLIFLSHFYDTSGYRKTGDSCFLVFFQGGSLLMGNNRAKHSDEELYFDSMHWSSQVFGFRYACQAGDFRGTGREDLVAANIKGDLFFYPNNGNFTLADFAEHLRTDTLLQKTHDPRIFPGNHYDFGQQTLAMRAVTRSSGDLSVDYLIMMDSGTNFATRRQIRVFRGGPDFGSHRLTIDSAEFTLHSPSVLDSFYGETPTGAMQCVTRAICPVRAHQCSM